MDNQVYWAVGLKESFNATPTDITPDELLAIQEAAGCLQGCAYFNKLRKSKPLFCGLVTQAPEFHGACCVSYRTHGDIQKEREKTARKSKSQYRRLR